MTLLGIIGLKAQSLKSMNPTQDVNRPFPNLIPTETLVFSLYLSKFANNLFIYLKGRNFCDHKLFQNKLLRTYFCDFDPKSQKFDPQNAFLDKSIPKTSSAKYGLRANHKNKFRK